ncbi:MAG: hypothetical protein GX443_09570 [Deltaproteobacteria bacterium]|nr:hypothetical protein [Deltaproteobacteria bacterium]
MNDPDYGEDRIVLMTIQNRQKPDQLIKLVQNRFNGHFETEGLMQYFGLKEIRVETEDIIASLQEYGDVISFLLETMSAAKDLGIPYVYENEFDFKGVRYSLREKDNLRLLKRLQ